MIEKTDILDRIKGLKAEQASLEATHNLLVKEHQAYQEQWTTKINSGKARFQQLQGAIEALQALISPKNGEVTRKKKNVDLHARVQDNPTARA